MLPQIRLSKGLPSSLLIQIHICIIVCGATTGSHFTQNLLLNAQQWKALQQALHIEISFDKVLQEDFGFLLKHINRSLLVCRLSEFQKVLLEVKSPSYAFLTFHFYTPPIRETKWRGWSPLCRSIFKAVSMEVRWQYSFMILYF